MNWPLAALIVAIVMLTLALWLKHEGDSLYCRVLDTVARRNKFVLKTDEREWCLREMRRSWKLLVFLGFVSIGTKILLPDDGDDADSAMLDAAAARCEESLMHLLMHYRQAHSE